MEKDDQEQAAMELAETGGALGLEVPESMEISIDEIALPELAHLGTMELLLQACANHLYSLDRMQTAWMSAMLVAEIPYFAASDEEKESGGIAEALTTALGFTEVAKLLGEAIPLLGGFKEKLAAGLLGFLGALANSLIGDNSANDEVGLEFRKELWESLQAGKTFEETIESYEPKIAYLEEKNRKELELKYALGIIPSQMLPEGYQQYGYNYEPGFFKKGFLSIDQRKKQEQLLALPQNEIDEYISEHIQKYNNWSDWSPEMQEKVSKYETGELLQQGPYQIDHITQQIDALTEKTENSTTATAGVQHMEVTINCNFDSVEMTIQDEEELAERIVEIIKQQLNDEAFFTVNETA